MALMGGTQDNGTWYVDDPATSILGEEIWGGDGAYVALLNDGLLRYASFQNGQIYRIEYNASNQLVSWALATTSLESNYLFIHPYVLDPNDSNIMYLPGDDRMYRNNDLSSIPDFQSTAHTTGWVELTNSVITGGGVISAVVASESNPNHRVYYGTSSGEVYRIDDTHTGDPAATNVTSGLFPGSGYVSSLAVHPDDANRVAVVFSNYSVQSIFYSDDAGATWTNVSGSLEENTDGSGNGPSVRWIEMGAISATETQYFVGTSTGLYSTTTLNGTSTIWTQEGSSAIGNVVVDMIDIRDSDGYIGVGTHGNGFYSSTLDRPATTGPGGVTGNLSLWLKADAGITESSGNVSAWADQSGNAYDFSDGGNSAYTYDADGLNYNPEIINSDGGNRRLENTTSITLQTVAIVTDPDSPDGLDNPFSEAGADDEGIRINETTTTSWNVPGGSEDFTDTSGQGWLNGTAGTDPAHANEPNILVVEASSMTTLSGGVELGDTKSNRYWHGSIAEVIGFAGTLTTTEREQIQSYLAIKYGITVSNNYLASDATTLWDATANATYHNDIAGIGRDDASDLDQKQSMSQSGGSLHIGLGALAADNASNSNAFGGDLSFMIWGHDNGSTLMETAITGTDVFTRMARTWAVSVTGTVGTVEVQIPHSWGATYLVVSNSSSFSSPTEYLLTHNEDGTRSVSVDFADGTFFSFGVGARPGGITSNLALWLKADAGVTETASNVSTWADQSGNRNDMATDGASNLPALLTTAINYNPAVEFDASNTEGLATSPIFGTTTYSDVNVFFVSTLLSESNSTLFMEQASSASTRMGITLYSDGDHLWDAGASSGDNRLSVSWTDSLDTPYLWSYEHESGTPRQAIYRDGTSVVSDATAPGFTLDAATQAYLGSFNGSTSYYDGDLAELLLYQGALTEEEQQKIETYLAIKYGISLGHDYVASNGATLWDATTNSMYNNRIVGIGRDDASDLDQKQSAADLISVALGSHASDNTSNSTTFSADLSFVLLGHNAGALTESDVMFGSSAAKLLDRSWFVQQTGTNELVEMQFDLNGVGVTGTEATDFWIVLDTDADPVTDHRSVIAAASFTAGIATFTGITLEDGDYISLVTDNPGNALLPVELTDFDAIYNEGQVHLSWSTASETNNAGFDVQRRSLSGEWTTVSFVEGQGYANDDVTYTFSDNVRTQAGNTVVYRLKQIDFDGRFTLSHEVSVEIPAPEGYALSAYPNPFNPVATIQYAVPTDGLVKLVVFDLQGRQVATLVDDVLGAGRYSVPFDASNLSSGTYVYRLETRDKVLTNTVLLVK